MSRYGARTKNNLLAAAANRLFFVLAPYLLMGCAPLQPKEGESLILQGARIYTDPWNPPIEDGTLVIENGRITALGEAGSVAIPSGLPSLDCDGLNITAGFWNSHVHFTELKWEDVSALPAGDLDQQLQDGLTQHGFTTVFDLSSDWTNTTSLRTRIESGEVPGPRIHRVGAGLLPAGGTPAPEILARMGWMETAMPEVANPQEATQVTQDLVARGVDGIKLFASAQGGQVMPAEIMAAAVAVAHRQELPVFVHPNSIDDIRAAIEAGVDVLAHNTPQAGSWDEELIADMIGGGMALTPTLTLWPQVLRGVASAERAETIAMAVQQVGAFHRAGGTVLFGTDLGAVHIDPLQEFVLMAGAGLTFADILAALTVSPADRFGAAHELGRIEPGYLADLVIFSGDPKQNIRALGDVQYTIRAGRIIYRGPEAREP